MSSSDGSLVLQIPSGALQADARIAINVLPPDSVSLGSVYRLDAGGVRFALPVTVAIELDSATLGNAPAAALGLAFRGSDGAWMADDSSGAVDGGGASVAHASSRSPTRVVVGRIEFDSEMYVTVRTLWKQF